MRRTSTEAPRPVPFSAKFQRVHPGTTGVTVLEHLERLDAVEASLQRLGIDDTMPESPQEVDVGESSRAPVVVLNPATPVAATSPKMSAIPFSPVGSPDGLPAVPEVDSSAVSFYEDDEEDVVAMSKSTSHMEGAPRRWQGHSRWGTDPRSRPGIGIDAGLDWIQPEDGEVPKRTVIVEVRFLPLRVYPAFL
jgi:phosphatidylinositol 4-kinase type 2